MLGVLAVGRVHSPRGELGCRRAPGTVGAPRRDGSSRGRASGASELLRGLAESFASAPVLAKNLWWRKVSPLRCLRVGEEGYMQRARSRLQNLMGLREHVFTELQIPPCVDGGGDLGLQTS